MTIIGEIMFLNSAVNPFLYVWRLTESRYQLKRIITFWNFEKLQKLEVERNIFFTTYEINTCFLESRSVPNFKKVVFVPFYTWNLHFVFISTRITQ